MTCIMSDIILFDLDFFLFSLFVLLKSGKTGYPILEPEFLSSQNVGY
jgi:hypothetical protein